MATRVASIIAEIGLDSSKFQSGVGGVTSGIDKIIKGTAGIATYAGIAAAAIGVTVAAMIDLERAAVESAKADAKLEAVLKSTGGAAGMTSDSLNVLADQISKNTGLDDELVKSAEAVMLTFTQVGKEAFPEATQAAADMAAVLGGDLQGSVIQVGKAMNDFSGYTALKRAGVSFTEEQIKQIKYFKETNNLVDYQKLVLKELSKEFGGAAKAINDAGDGAENLNVSIGNLKETFGGSFIGMFRSFNTTLTDMIDGFLKADDVFDDQSRLFNEAGVQVNILNAHYKDGILLSKEHADEILNNAQVAENSANNYRAMAAAIAEVGIEAALTEEELKTLSENNKTYVGAVESFQSNFDTHQETQNSLMEDRNKLIDERNGLIARGYSTASEKVLELDGRLAENQKAIDENAAEYEKAGARIVASLLEKRLEADGELSKADTEFLLDFQEKHGLITSEMRTAAEAALTEVENLAQSIREIPDKEVNITVNTHYVSSGGRTSGHEDTGIGGYATGGDFIVPQGFNNDNYPIRAQSGEHVSITPAGQTSTDLSAIVRELRRLPIAIRDTMLIGPQ